MSGRMTITARDMRAMLDIANTADRAEDQPIPNSVLTGLLGLVGCDTLVFTQFDARERLNLLCQCDGDFFPMTTDEEAKADEVFYRYYWESPCCYPDVSGDLDRVTMLSDFYSDRQWFASPMYNEYTKHAGGGKHEMMLCLPSRPGRVLRFLFWRYSGTNFSERDRGLLTLLRPHLDRIYRTQRRYDPADALTPRQRELLTMVAAGHTNGQIARRLSISEATVRKHLEHIFEKLEVRSRTAAVAKAFGIDQ